MQKHPLWFGLVVKSPLEVSIAPLIPWGFHTYIYIYIYIHQINFCDNFLLALMDERNHVRVA